VVILSDEDWAMRKLVIGSGATLIAISGVLAANAEPVTKAGAVQVTEKTSAAPAGEHKLKAASKIKFDGVEGEGVRNHKLSKQGGWKLAPNGENKLKAGSLKVSPAKAESTVSQTDGYMK
jgi:hypothetical protein